MFTKYYIKKIVIAATASTLLFGCSFNKSEVKETATPAPTATPTATATPTPTPTPTPEPTSTPTPSATPTPSPTPTPTPKPQATLSVDKTEVTSKNGAEIELKISSTEGTTISASSSTGISTWIEPGILFIYPKQSGTVTLTAKGEDFESAEVIIKVTYDNTTPSPTPTPTPTSTPTPTPTATPAPTPTPEASTSTVLTPNVSRDEDLSFWFRNGMEGTKDYFFDYSAQYGVDPFLVIAIADHETGYGSSSLCLENNNFGGMFGKDGNPKYFESKSQGVDELCWLIGWYYRQGRTTIEQIGEWYCPGDPVWVSRVTTIYNSFHQ